MFSNSSGISFGHLIPEAAMSDVSQPDSTQKWQDNLVTRLSALYIDQANSDVDIVVGEKKIPCHKTVLCLNSDLLTAGEVSFNSKTNKTEIELLPEFSDMAGIVSVVIGSFYIGKINVNSENAKGVYKFAICYSVSWLVEHVFPILKMMITPQNFAELFDFAQNIRCKSLTSACLQKFDDKHAEAMSDTQEWLDQDYYRVKLISLSTDVQITEIKMFQIICKWLDHKPEDRSSVCKSLLSNVHYELIDHANLVNQVYRWINEYKFEDEEVRFYLFKTVSTATKKNKPGYPSSFCRNKLNSQEAGTTSTVLFGAPQRNVNTRSNTNRHLFMDASYRNPWT